MFFYFLIKINSDPNIFYILIRTLIIYVYAIFLIRIGNKRFNFQTSFDVVLIIIIGAVLSRAINGSSTLLAAITGSSLLVFLHWLFARASFYSREFGRLVKGNYEILIKDGELIWDVMEKNQVTEEDLREMIREKLNHNNLEHVKEARLERTGRISFINN